MKRFLRFRNNLHLFRSSDWFFVFAIFTLILFGLSAIYSVELSQQGSGFFNMKKQLIAAVIASGIFVAIANSNYKLLRNYSVLLYLVGVVLLVTVLFLGTNVRGATGWFVFGLFSFQPVEFMKVALAVALATYFSRRARPEFGLRELFESLVIAGVPAGLTLLQPDLGSASILMGMWFVIVLFAGVRLRYVVSLLLIGAILATLAWNFTFAEYQKARILTFVNPGYDTLGQGYNVNQAIIAIGSGGLFGRGLGFGSQSQLKFLPESQTDFIFAVIAEELGFIGVCLVLGAFTLLIYRIFMYARMSRDDFPAYLLVVIAGLLALQIFVNVGMNLGLFPVTGIGLPLVSYGGSSLVFLMMLLGVVMSIALRTKRMGKR